MRSGTITRFGCSVLACAALLAASDAGAADAPCVVEITPPPPSLGADAPGLKREAEAEVRQQAALLHGRRKVVISVAVLRREAPLFCSVNATVRDARTGAMLAVIATDARAVGTVSAEQKKELAYAAVRSAVRSVPKALDASR